jgi:hypothetical protein
LCQTEATLLLLILADVRRIESSELSTVPDSCDAWTRELWEINDLTRGLGVRVRGVWIGRTPADRTARRRGLLKLEAAGLVVLRAAYGRVRTHVDLTVRGRKAAEALVAENLAAEQLPAPAALASSSTRSDQPEPRQIGRRERPTRQNANAAVSIGTGSPEGVLS